MEFLIGSGFVVFIGSLFGLAMSTNLTTAAFKAMVGLELGFALVVASTAPEYHEPPAVVIEADSTEVVNSDFLDLPPSTSDLSK